MTFYVNPYTQMSISTVPERFFGRRGEIEFLLRGITSEEPQSFAINGLKKLGKTSLIQYLRHPDGATKKYSQLLTNYQTGLGPGKLAFLYFDTYKQQGAKVLADLPVRLGRLPELTERLDGILEFPHEQFSTAEETRNFLKQCFQLAADKNLRIVICLDHFDDAYKSLDYDTDIFFRSLANYQPFILVTNKSLNSLAFDPTRNSPLLSILTLWTLKMLTIDEAEGLVRSPAIQAGLPFGESDVQFILQLCGYHPFLLALVCEYMFSLQIENPAVQRLIPPDEIIQDQVAAQLSALPAVNSLFQLIWSQVTENEQRVLKQIARDEPVQHHDKMTLSALATVHHLVIHDLSTGKYKLFGKLFSNFLLSPQTAESGEEIQQIRRGLSGHDRKLLEYLIAHSGQVCTFEEISRNVWGEQKVVKRAIEASIHRLRSHLLKQSGSSNAIQNIRGRGYQYTSGN